MINIDKYVFEGSLSDYNEKQVAFVKLFILPKYNAVSAYMEIYDCTEKSAYQLSYKLLKQQKITDLVYHFRMMALKEQDVSYYGQVEKLVEIYQIAMQMKDLKAAMKAIEMINKMLGYDITRVDVTSGGDSITITYMPPVYKEPVGTPKENNYKTIEEAKILNLSDKSRTDYYHEEADRKIKEIEDEDKKIKMMSKAQRQQYLRNKANNK